MLFILLLKTFLKDFICALIFFIAGKDDFGRTENKLIIKEKVKEEENIKPAVGVKKHS